MPAKIGAIGFCFGGATALELARSGADIAGVVTFHGGLDTHDAGQARHGEGQRAGAQRRRRPAAPTGDIAAFEKEMDAAGADWQFVNFSGAVHCFALPDANKPPGCVYNELRRAPRRADDARCSSRERFAAK